MIPRHPNGADVAIRLLIWACCVAVQLVLSMIVMELATQTLRSDLQIPGAAVESPRGWAEPGHLQVGIVVVFGLSLLSLMWPRVPRGLVVFGVFWAFIGGLWVDLFVRGWVWGWLLRWALEA